MNKLSQRISFFKAMIADFRVGSIASSSQYVINQVISMVKNNLHSIIEQGSGDGALTKVLISKLSPNGSLVLIESNPEFIKELQKIKDKRITIFAGTVEDFYNTTGINHPKVDLIVSSIPFSFVKKDERENMIKKDYEILKETGSIIIFHQYSFLMSKYIKKYFKNTSVFFEFRNIPPCFGIIGYK